MQYGLIGKTLKHSYSKEIHEALYHQEYQLKEIPADSLDSFLKEKDFKAINVTIPYKEKVIPYLDYISPEVKEIGACNTIVNQNGKLYGYNTDTLGLEDLIVHNQIDVKGKTVLILGTGGTSKTARYTLNKLGAKEIYFASRSQSEGCISYWNLNSIASKIEVIVNTTPCGMWPALNCAPLSLDPFSSLEAVVDVIYNPLNTRLVLEARKRGIKALNGLRMLVAQALFAAEKFLSTTFDKDFISSYTKKLQKEKQNIVLIGMPSSGKSTIGKRIAELTSRPFYDVDEEIEKKIKMTIKEFFEEFGEESFRIVEEEVIKSLSTLSSAVIATGGGSILRDDNVFLLKNNGVLYFLNRSLSLLITTSSRPLSSNAEDLKKRYEERMDRYLTVSDYIVDGDRSVEEISKDIAGGVL